MQRVQGFGGFFFRAKDPEGLAKWYHDHLGINPTPKNMEMPPWVTESGVTVFGPFAADTDYFASDKTFMLNFRVADLDAIDPHNTKARWNRSADDGSRWGEGGRRSAPTKASSMSVSGS